MTETEIVEWAKKNHQLVPFDTVEKSGGIASGDIYLFKFSDQRPIPVDQLRFVLIKKTGPEVFQGLDDFKRLYDLSHELPDWLKKRGA